MTVFDYNYSSSYDHLYSNKDYQSECNLILEAIKRFSKEPIKTIFDIGCGTGNHAIELANRGYHVTGLDLSQAMLEEAVRKSASMPTLLQPEWQCGDVRSFDTTRKFDCGIMMFAVIGYLSSNEDVLSGLRNIRSQLKLGAIFICDFWYGPSVITAPPPDRVRTLKTFNGQMIRVSNTTIDVVQHSANVSFQLWNFEGKNLTNQTAETHILRYFFPQEFSLFLNLAGFKLHSMSAFPSLDNKLKEDSLTALIVAEAI